MDAGGTAATEDWGPFGRPLFEDPSARALSRVGVIDVGSNSVRMVIFDGAARSPAYFFNEKVMAGLGAGMAETGRLNPEGKVRAMAALKRCQLLASAMGIAPLTAPAMPRGKSYPAAVAVKPIRRPIRGPVSVYSMKRTAST